MHAPDHGRVRAPADHADHFDLGDGADPCIAPLYPRNHDQLPAGRGVESGGRVRRLDREGHDHPRKHDAGRERKQRKGFCVEFSHLGCIPLVFSYSLKRVSLAMHSM